MTAGTAARIVAFALVATSSTQAGAQQPRATEGVRATPAGGQLETVGFRARFGTEVATRLVRSTDPDEQLRGIERLATVHTPEALVLLERTARAGVPGAADPHTLEGVARRDPRSLLAAVRGLAAWIDHEQARTALASIVAAPTQSFATRGATISDGDPSAADAEGAARVLLARQEAAIALAESGNTLATEALIAIARSAGPGQGPALDALAIYPPAPPLLGGVVLTTAATVALAVTVGDLRALDAIEGAMNASDPALRAAALVALGVAGDSRILEAARTALHDRDARVRVAAGDALVRLAAPDAGTAVEGLVADDATALDALHLAQLVQGEGVTKAAAARAAASANAEMRSAAVAALGRQGSPLAIGALATFVAEPAMQGDATCAIARSPSAAAMPAIEAMAGAGATRRLAARAYLLRRLVRQERSPRLDSLLAELAGSNDARDRAVAVQARVAFAELPVARALQDRDPRVRRAAAMGALAHWNVADRATLLARMVVEPDPVTRQVLALGLEDGDANRIVPTVELFDRAQAGEPDAPLASLALAQRAEEQRAAEFDALLESHDPVLRASVARGLGASAAHDAVGRLARAYAIEGDAQVRRVIVASLSARSGEALAPGRRDTLELAARLDPDRTARWMASRALSGATFSQRPLVHEVVWLRLMPAPGATLPRDITAALVQSDGVARPIAFDEDGYALVPGVPAGDARLRLAPRPASYEASPP